MAFETELTLADLHEMTSTEIAQAAIEENSVPSGKYLTKVREIYPKRNPEDADRDPGRAVVSLAVTFYNDSGERVGDAFIKTSPEARYTASGKLDAPAKRFNELQRALGIKGSAGEVYAASKQSGFMTKIREQYIVDEGDVHPSHADKRAMNGVVFVDLQPEETDLRTHYIEAGYEPRVAVDRIYKA